VIKKYYINEKNWVVYERIENMIVVLFMYFTDPTTIPTDIKTYFDMFANETDAEFLTTYPGTLPPVAKSHLAVVRAYNLPYRFYYGENEIFDSQSLESRYFTGSVASEQAMLRSNEPQSVCDCAYAEECKNQNIGLFALCSPLRSGITLVRSPVKYYRLDEDGFFVEEYLEKPPKNFPVYQSMRLSQKFIDFKIQRVDGKLKYLPK
jgi:hypothetical protein